MDGPHPPAAGGHAHARCTAGLEQRELHNEANVNHFCAAWAASHGWVKPVVTSSAVTACNHAAGRRPVSSDVGVVVAPPGRIEHVDQVELDVLDQVDTDTDTHSRSTLTQAPDSDTSESIDTDTDTRTPKRFQPH